MLSQLKTKYADKVRLSGPSSAHAIQQAEEALGANLPDELRNALLESDGIKDEYGCDLLWPLSRIVADNRAFRDNTDYRKLYMPFDAMLFFADAGNGDQFAFTVLDGVVRRNDVFVWNHEDDSRTWIAPSLGQFYDGWLSGSIAI